MMRYAAAMQGPHRNDTPGLPLDRSTQRRRPRSCRGEEVSQRKLNAYGAGQRPVGAA